MADSIRAALERLVNAVEVYDATGMDVLGDAIAAARAVLAEQHGEAIGPEWQPCVKLPITVNVREQRPGETHVSTREGITPVQPDDLIMRGVAGEEYPIGRELFNKTYRLGIAEPTPPAEGEVAAISNAIDTMRLALRSYGVFLAPDPPQDAWKFQERSVDLAGVTSNEAVVSMRLRDAIRQLEKLKESINE